MHIEDYAASGLQTSTTRTFLFPAGKNIPEVVEIRIVQDGVEYQGTEMLKMTVLAALVAWPEGAVMTPAHEELLSAEEAGKRLGVSRPTIYAWQDLGILGRVNDGNRRLVPAEDIPRGRQYIDDREELRRTA